jgi:hypothetical protein
VGLRPDAVDVANRPQALACAQVIVDPDAAGVWLDADGLEADILDAGSPAARSGDACRG